jgi:hypothetical protein
VVKSNAVDVKVEVALLGLFTVPPLPLTMVQVPVWPVRGAVAPRVTEVVPQVAGALSGPAFAMGGFLNITTTVSVEEVQGLFEIVHTKVTIACPLPAENPAMFKVDVLLNELPNDGTPVAPVVLTILHIPVPVAGAFAPKIADVPHID